MLHYAAQEAAPMTTPEPRQEEAFAATPPAGVVAVNVAPPEAPPPAPQAAAAARVVASGTMIGVAAPDVARAIADAQARAAHAQAQAQAPQSMPDAPRTSPSPGANAGAMAGGKTMLGVQFALPGAAAAALPQAPELQRARGLPTTAPEIPSARARTMLGVAMPGVAPSAASGAASDGLAPATSTLQGTLMSPNATPHPLAGGGTMLGVAIPGIAPTAAGAVRPPEVQIAPVGLGHANAAARPVRSKLANTAVGDMPFIPAPAPYVDDVSMPEAPRRRATGGVPITLVATIIGGVVLLGGIGIAIFYRGAPPLAAKPQLDAQGNEVLHLQCENCADGTTAQMNGAKATFKSNAADLALSKPLNVGENDLTVTLDRPGSGRDESVKLSVPVAFRIRADLSDINAKTPVIAVRVSAAPGSEVTVDKKPLALDATGNGSYVIDVSADTEGPTEDVRLIDRKIDYTIVSSGGASSKGAPAKPDIGQVSARIAIVPLRLDAPSAHAITDGASFTIAGQTIAGGAVTIDGTPATMQPDGSFADSRAATAEPLSVEIRATAPGRAPRTAHVTVMKVSSLDLAAKAAEQTPLLTYDQIAPDIASKVGQRAVIAGEVLEARVAGHETIALVNDARGCKSGPCLARVIAAEDAKISRGQSVRAYGEVTRAVTTSAGKTVPEMQADFVARGSGSRK
jgi:hypothetical protein